MSDRIGTYYLKRRGQRGTFQICWTDERRIPHSRSTGTADPERAREALREHALAHTLPPEQWRRVRDPKLALVLMRYRVARAGTMASLATFDAAMREVLEVCGDIAVSEFGVSTQLIFIASLRERGLGDATIKRKLSALRPAFAEAKRANLLSEIPPAAGKRDWNPQLKTRTAAPAPEIVQDATALRFARVLTAARRATKQVLMSIGVAVATVASWVRASMRALGAPTAYASEQRN